MSRQRSARFEGGGRGMQHQPRMERRRRRCSARRRAWSGRPNAAGSARAAVARRGHQRDG
jgi:hypothetical protein